MAIGRRQQHVLEAGQVVVALRRLERAQDAEATDASGLTQLHPLARDRQAPLGIDHSTERVQERGLPRAVGTDQAEDLAVVEREAHPVDRAHTSELHVDVLGVEQRSADRRAVVNAHGIARIVGQGRELVHGGRGRVLRDLLVAGRDPEHVAQPGPPLRVQAPEGDGSGEAPDTHEAFREHDHREHQEHPEDDVAEVARSVVLAEHVDGQRRAADPEHAALEPLGHEHVERRARDRAPARVQAAEDEHHEDPETEVDVEGIGIGEALDVHEDRAGRGGDHRTEHEHRDAVPQHGHAEGRGDEVLVASRDDLALHRSPRRRRSRGASPTRPRPTTPRRCGTHSARRSRTRRW